MRSAPAWARNTSPTHTTWGMGRSTFPRATGYCAASATRAGCVSISTSREMGHARVMNDAEPTWSKPWNPSMYEITRRTMLKMTAAATTVPIDRVHYRILDPHVHVWKHDPQFPFAAGAKVPDFDATPEMLLDLMNANGVEKTVIMQVIHYR